MSTPVPVSLAALVQHVIDMLCRALAAWKLAGTVAPEFRHPVAQETGSTGSAGACGEAGDAAVAPGFGSARRRSAVESVAAGGVPEVARLLVEKAFAKARLAVRATSTGRNWSDCPLRPVAHRHGPGQLRVTEVSGISEFSAAAQAGRSFVHFVTIS